MSTQQNPDSPTQGEKSPSLEPKDFFKFVLDTRNFEITNFWHRSNYFLVLNTGLAIGFFSVKPETAAQFSLLLPALGVIVSFLWTRVALGSKFWQIHWESKLAEVERMYIDQGILDGELKLFSTSMRSVKKDVRRTLRDESHHVCCARLINKFIVRKPSVTLAMITLSLLFTLTWFALLVASICRYFW